MEFRRIVRGALAVLQTYALGLIVSVGMASADTIQIDQISIGTSIYTFSVVPSLPDSFGAGSAVRAFYTPDFSTGAMFGGFTDTVARVGNREGAVAHL